MHGRKHISWFDLCEAFKFHFFAKKIQPTTIVVLRRVTQGKKETLHSYINRFTKVGVIFGGSTESLKCWIFEKCLRSDCKFWEKLGLKEARNLKDLVSREQPYINYEEKFVVERDS